MLSSIAGWRSYNRMLHFLVSGTNRGPLRRYLRNWGRPLWGDVRILSYETLGDASRLPNGTYIFCDTDLLPPCQAAVANTAWETLAARGAGARLLNRPDRIASRYQLLRVLSDSGRNAFNVYRIDEIDDQLRYPVFLRHATEHTGALSPLLANRHALEKAIADVLSTGCDGSELLVTEFLDTSRDGLFRKYAAVRVGDTIIAHHIMFAREWIVKGPSLVSAEIVSEERGFQLTNPHRSEIADVFRLARIDYGRVDYGLLGDEIQVWEINTNPTLLYPPKIYEDAQMEAKRWFADRLNQALRAVDDDKRSAGFRERLRSYWDLHRK
jgi:hypothetical protein